MKICYKCKKEKNLPFFHKDRTTSTGFSSLCKDCTKKRDKNRKSYFNHRKPKKKIYDQNYKKENKELIKNKALKYIYGITLNYYHELLTKQNNTCAICHEKETLIDYRTGKTRDLCIDHCHKTNEIRGLLCSRCNMSIGLLDDSILLLKNAIEYLENYKKVLTKK